VTLWEEPHPSSQQPVSDFLILIGSCGELNALSHGKGFNNKILSAKRMMLWFKNLEFMTNPSGGRSDQLGVT
jgi:hypothetical protein